jgi:hypothetical protein
LGGVVAAAIDCGPAPALRLSSYIFFTLFVFAGLGLSAGAGWMLSSLAPTSGPARAAKRAILVCAMMLAPVAQVVAWRGSSTDAQGALLFLFLPLYSVAPCLAVGAIAALVHRLLLRSRSDDLAR